MNYPDSSTVSTTAKKIRFSSATRALFLGLVLALLGAPALAGEKPIPGIEFFVKKKDGGSIINTRTGADGTFQFNGLAAGDYDLSVGGKLVHTLRVGRDGSIKGVLSRKPDGKAFIAFNGQVGVGPDIPLLGSGSGVIIAILAAIPVPDFDRDLKTDVGPGSGTMSPPPGVMRSGPTGPGPAGPGHGSMRQ